MIDGLVSALAIDGLIWIGLAAIVAGVVRGFAGFGAGMIFIPFAGVFVDPITVVVGLQIMDGLGALPLLPRGYRDGEPGQIARLSVAAILTIPLGVYFLATTEATIFRWVISALIFVLLVLMASGWRYRKRLSTTGTLGVGAVAGFMSGFAGLGGPPVILMHMSGPFKAVVIRANIILFFFATTLVGFGLLGYAGLLTEERIWFGLILTLPYSAATLLGARIFRPEYETQFRAVAYVVIMGSVVLSLPLWS